MGVRVEGKMVETSALVYDSCGGVFPIRFSSSTWLSLVSPHALLDDSQITLPDARPTSLQAQRSSRNIRLYPRYTRQRSSSQKRASHDPLQSRLWLVRRSRVLLLRSRQVDDDRRARETERCRSSERYVFLILFFGRLGI